MADCELLCGRKAETAGLCADHYEESEYEGGRVGCVCWGSNAIGHTDLECPLV